MGTSNTLQTLWRKIHVGVKTHKPCMPYLGALSTLANSRPLPSWPMFEVLPKVAQKNSKMAKTWHDLNIWPTCIDEHGFVKKHRKLSNICLSHIMKQPIAKSWSNDCDWAIGFDQTVTIGVRVQRCPTGFWGGQHVFWGLVDIQLSINNSTKNKKNTKHAHIVILCDLVMIKMRNTVYEHFHEKLSQNWATSN
jgi:hypothetical protein